MSQESMQKKNVDAKCVASDDGAVTVDSEMISEVDADDDDERDFQDDSRATNADNNDVDLTDEFDMDYAQGRTQLHLAAERGDTEAVGSLLMSSEKIDVLDTKNNTPLHYATRKGRVDVVNLLLRNGANVNSRNSFGQTALHLAAKLGDMEAVRSLLMSSANADVPDQHNNTPLHIATRYGKVDVVNLLLSNAVNVNSNFFLDQTALHVAVESDHFAIAQFLLDSNADVQVTYCYSNTPIDTAARPTYRPGHGDSPKFLRLLLRCRAQRKLSNDGPQHFAAKCGNGEEVPLHLNSDENLDATNSDGDTPLHLASENGHFEVVEVLLKNRADANILNEICETPLHIAAEFGYSEISKALIDHGANIHARNKAKMTPLHLACQNGHVEVANLLISKNVDVNACNSSKATPLHLVCQYGHASIVEILLDNHATMDVTEQSEETPFYLATKNGHADIVDLLIRRGVCDFVLTNKYKTPLHVAVEEGHTKVVEVILKHSRRIYKELTNDRNKHQENVKKLIELLNYDGRCVSARVVLAEKYLSLELLRNSDGYTALDLAVRSIKPEMVQLFLNADRWEYSEDHIRAGLDNLIDAIMSNEDYKVTYEKFKTIAQALLNSNNSDVNHQNDRGETPLHKFIGRLNNLWAKNINTDKHIANVVAQFLLEKGADYNMKTPSGKTPLIIASEMGSCEAIKILFDLEKKSGTKLDLDARDQYGETALIKAAERQHVSVVQMLLDHKASVNICNYHGLTALHAAIVDQPNEKWFDLHFFCEGLLRREFDLVASLEICSWDMPYGEYETSNRHTVFDRLQKYLEHGNKITRLKEEVVKCLLFDDKINLNAVDFRENSPLDLAVASSKRITSATIEALTNHSAIEKFIEPEDESSIEAARVDERGRNPLHRLIISRDSDYFDKCMGHIAEAETFRESFNLILTRILLRPEKFRHLATATDDKGRTPFHYAVVASSHSTELINLLLNLGSNINATDMYGKTPLHYAEFTDRYMYAHLVQCGSDENTKDNNGHTHKELRQLRESVMVKEYDITGHYLFGRTFQTKDFAQLFNTKHVTKLTKHRMAEAIRVHNRSLGPQGSSEEAIWKIWTHNDLFRLNSRIRHLKPSVQLFIDRLANGIKEKDGRFDCQPILVGSSDEETQTNISADFDFNFQLIKFSQLCKVFPHPLGPRGYFQLRRKSNEDAKSRIDEDFNSFFNIDQCLLTNEVNSRFKIILNEVLSDAAFWKGEHRFDWKVENAYERRCRSQFGLCKTLLLKMINPIEDGEGGFLFIHISIDIVACVQVTDWWPNDPLPIGICPAMKANGSTFVFDGPRFNPNKPNFGVCPFSDTFARISFAKLESQLIKESLPLIKAAYIVCKVLKREPKTTYQLKNCLLFCMEALKSQSESEAKNDDEIISKRLAFWVERIMFCFVEFSRHDVYPCYFMPSFRQQVLVAHHKIVNLEPRANSLEFKAIFSLYLGLFPDDATIDVPVVYLDHCLDRFDPMNVQICKEFDRDELIRKLSSRTISTD